VSPDFELSQREMFSFLRSSTTELNSDGGPPSRKR
jgi:hypothetical protein